MHVDLGRCFLPLVSFLRYQGTGILYQGEALNVLLPTLGSYFCVKKKSQFRVCKRERQTKRQRKRERENSACAKERDRQRDRERERERARAREVCESSYVDPFTKRQIFRIVQIDNMCRLQNKCDLKTEILFEVGRTHFGKRRKCWLPAFSPFPTMFSKGPFNRVVKSRNCVVKSYVK